SRSATPPTTSPTRPRSSSTRTARSCRRRSWSRSRPSSPSSRASSSARVRSTRSRRRWTPSPRPRTRSPRSSTRPPAPPPRALRTPPRRPARPRRPTRRSSTPSSKRSAEAPHPPNEKSGRIPGRSFFVVTSRGRGPSPSPLGATRGEEGESEGEPDAVGRLAPRGAAGAGGVRPGHRPGLVLAGVSALARTAVAALAAGSPLASGAAGPRDATVPTRAAAAAGGASSLAAVASASTRVDAHAPQGHHERIAEKSLYHEPPLVKPFPRRDEAHPDVTALPGEQDRTVPATLQIGPHFEALVHRDPAQ